MGEHHLLGNCVAGALLPGLSPASHQLLLCPAAPPGCTSMLGWEMGWSGSRVRTSHGVQAQG